MKDCIIPSTEHKKLAIAIYYAFRQQGQYVKTVCRLNEPDDFYSVIVDGDFDFYTVSNDVIQILLENSFDT